MVENFLALNLGGSDTRCYQSATDTSIYRVLLADSKYTSGSRSDTDTNVPNKNNKKWGIERRARWERKPPPPPFV